MAEKKEIFMGMDFANQAESPREKRELQAMQAKIMDNPQPEMIRKWIIRKSGSSRHPLLTLKDRALMAAIMKLRIQNGVKVKESLEWLHSEHLLPTVSRR